MSGQSPPSGPDAAAEDREPRPGLTSAVDVRDDAEVVSAVDSDRGIERAETWPTLRVDPVEHAAEIGRFWAKVRRGPDAADCWIWVGAIADDGYGRFWLNRGAPRVVRPHRYAAALALGLTLTDADVVEHIVCDNPVCVRAEPDHATGHVWPSTQAANLARMGQRGRGGGAWWQHRFASTDRASLAARSRAQRAAVLDGWDAERLRQALDDLGTDTLF